MTSLRKLQNAEKERIAKSGVVEFFLDAMRGEMPVRDRNGAIIKTEVLTPDQRLTAATTLLKRVLPELKSQDIDLTTSGTVALKVVTAPFPSPNSAGEDAKVIEAAVAPAIEQKEPAPEPSLAPRPAPEPVEAATPPEAAEDTPAPAHEAPARKKRINTRRRTRRRSVNFEEGV